MMQTRLGQSLTGCVARRDDNAERSRLARIITDPRGAALKFVSRQLRKISSPISFPLSALIFTGDRLRVRIPDEVAETLVRYGIFEPELTRFLIDQLEEGMTFVDIGAHVGYYSVVASRLVGEEGSVHSFEPTPRTHEMLVSNLAAFEQAHAVPVAIWSEEATLSLRDFGAAYGAYNTVLRSARTGDAASSRRLLVDAIPLDRYVDDTGIIPDVVKIDAESAESQVLDGMQRTIESFRPVITLEVGDLGVADAPISRVLVDRLIAQGYVAHEPTSYGLRPHRPQSKYGYGNLVFIHPKGSL